MWNCPTFSFESRLLMNSPPSIGWDGKENLVVTKFINQWRFENYAVLKKTFRPKKCLLKLLVLVYCNLAFGKTWLSSRQQRTRSGSASGNNLLNLWNSRQEMLGHKAFPTTPESTEGLWNSSSNMTWVYFIHKFVKTTLQECEVQRTKGKCKHLAKCSNLEKRKL